ncbi:MAG: hypothetical protein PVH00_00975 [Gemmatimonadota bacterium]|jgi:hypothetical protein
MEIAAAQKEVRFVFHGGFAGQLVSATLWAASAAAGTWGTTRSAVLVLVLGGFLIFPLTTVLLRVMGHRAALSPANSLNQLAVQIAFSLPLVLPVVGAAALHRIEWFYPAFMVALGAHYLPFTFLYGMRLFAALAGVLVAAGVGLGLYGPDTFAAGGWLTALVLLLAAFAGRAAVLRERRAWPDAAADVC